MYRILLLFVLVFPLWQCQGQQLSDRSADTRPGPVGGPCDGCELIFVGLPDQPSARDTSAAWYDSGPRLVIDGTVFASDGVTPAADVILYYWQTDTSGLYTPDADTPASARRHGRLRGWVRTGPDGRYAIHTIRPGSYPGRDAPAHIHLVVKEPGIATPYYLDDFVFADDPLLTPAKREALRGRGGSGVLRPVWREELQIAERDIFLGLRIPNY